MENVQTGRWRRIVRLEDLPVREYRAVTADLPHGEEHGEPRATEEEARADLLGLLAEADPSYDDGWVEVRYATGWMKQEPLPTFHGEQ